MSNIRPFLKKKEKVKSRTLIDQLFKEGHSKVFFPLRLVWMQAPLPHPVPVQFAVTIPKRSFPNATDRNRLKRQIREAYRLQKYLIWQNMSTEENQQIALMFILLRKEKPTYQQLEKSMESALKYLAKQTQEMVKK